MLQLPLCNRMCCKYLQALKSDHLRDLELVAYKCPVLKLPFAETLEYKTRVSENVDRVSCGLLQRRAGHP